MREDQATWHSVKCILFIAYSFVNVGKGKKAKKNQTEKQIEKDRGKKW